MSRTLPLRSPADAELLIEHFNGFHDGFIRELRLRSHDRFSQQGSEPWDRGHEVTGRFDVELEIAHYNYGEGPRPLDQRIRGRFEDVSGFCLDLRGVRSYEWPIQNVRIEAGERVREDGTRQPCLSLAFLWSALDGDRWATRDAQLFEFSSAEFEEL